MLHTNILKLVKSLYVEYNVYFLTLHLFTVQGYLIFFIFSEIAGQQSFWDKFEWNTIKVSIVYEELPQHQDKLHSLKVMYSKFKHHHLQIKSMCIALLPESTMPATSRPRQRRWRCPRTNSTIFLYEIRKVLCRCCTVKQLLISGENSVFTEMLG